MKRNRAFLAGLTVLLLAGISLQAADSTTKLTPRGGSKMKIEGTSNVHDWRADSPLILDLACGRGRNARLLQSVGCRVICADIDRSALRTTAQEPYALLCDEKGGAGLDDHRLLPVVVDLRDQSWPFKRHVLDGAILVHYLRPELFSPLAMSMRSGGTLLIETVANRGGNYLELPMQGELRSALAEGFTSVEYTERTAGPPGGGRVTVKAIARRR